MKITNKKWHRLLQQHKKLIAGIDKVVANENFGILKRVKETGLKLAIFYADFKCQKCGNSNFLTIHHLITRDTKEFLDKVRYLAQRNYWANIVIFCNKCHIIQPGHNGCNPQNMQCLDEKKIDKIKKWFKDGEKKSI